MKREIFISYSRSDKDLVHPFAEQISKAVGADCWIDLKGIESGEEFEHVIMAAIDECKIVLFMLSDSSLSSPWTKREVYYAESQGKRIVPVLVQGSKLRGWFQFHFGNIDFVDIRSEEHKEKLIENLQDWLGVEEARPAEEKAVPEVYYSSVNRFFTIRNLAIAVAVLAVVIGISVYAYLHRIVSEGYYHEGMAPVENGMGYWGFRDKTGKQVIPCKWNSAESFSEGLACVQNNDDKYGYIDKTGKQVIPCEWNSAESFSEGLACVQKKSYGKYGYIDKTGKLVIPCKWSSARSFYEGLAFVQNSDHKYGLIDKTGELAVQCKWSEIDYEYSDDMMKVRDSYGDYGFINTKGEEVIPCEWLDAYSFYEGLARVKDSYGDFGFIDKKGETVIPCTWKDARDFSEGLACVMDENEEWGYIDKTGELVIPCKWDYADSFSGGTAIVEDSNGEYEIDKKGKVIEELVGDCVHP